MTDVYQAPEAELTEFATSDEYGSVERAVLGEYEFDIGGALNEAWGKLKGNKWKFFLCGLVYLVAISVLEVITSVSEFSGLTSLEVLIPVLIGEQIIYTLIATPLGVGLGFIGVRIAMDTSYSPGSLFAFFQKTLRLFFASVLVFLVVALGFLCLILPGIYLLVAYAYVPYLVADKNLGVWESMEISRKAVTKNWFPIFGFFILLFIIVIAGFMALLIGLIWAAPLAAIAWGISYRNIFGVEAETLARQ